jgi:glycosyltransferase-like protein
MPDSLRSPWPSALRVGLLTHSVNPRGGVVHTLELARALHGLGHEVTVFAPARPGQHFFREVPHAVSLVPVGPAPPGMADMVADRIQAFVHHLAGVLRQQSFDVLHTHDGIGGNALATLVQAGAVPGFVRTVHHLDVFDDDRLDGWQRRAVVAAAQLLCVSPAWCTALREQFGRESALVSNGVDLQRYTRTVDATDAELAARLGLRPGAPRWLAVGGIEERKNTLRVLEAFLQLRVVHPGAQLIVAGGASLLDHSAYVHRFHSLAAAAGLATGPGGDLVVTGALPDALMPALFRQAGALVMPSLNEGFGLVVLESLACGTPVVVSRRPPFTEYLDDSVAAGHALYTEPLDSTAVAQSMQRALQPQRRTALAHGVPAVCLRHGWTESAARHVALYRAHQALKRAAAHAA